MDKEFEIRFNGLPKDVQEIIKKHVKLLGEYILRKRIEYLRGGEIKMPTLNVKNNMLAESFKQLESRPRKIN